MAQAIVEFGNMPAQSRYGAADILDIQGAKSEEVTTSGTSAATTIEATVGQAAAVTNNGAGLMWVTFGQAPTAAVGTTFVVPAGATRYFGGLRTGDKAALIDDS